MRDRRGADSLTVRVSHCLRLLVSLIDADFEQVFAFPSPTLSHTHLLVPPLLIRVFRSALPSGLFRRRPLGVLSGRGASSARPVTSIPTTGK